MPNFLQYICEWLEMNSPWRAVVRQLPDEGGTVRNQGRPKQ
jgi:hypothetical protein